MLKKRDLDMQEVTTLYTLSTDAAVYPYVRQKASTVDEFYFLTKQMIIREQNRELISRTILDEFEQPIGTITLYDIENNRGFLATCVGKPYFGKGYNKMAKEQFLHEIFINQNIETVFLKINRHNIRSLKAIAKLPYSMLANELYKETYETINAAERKYELFVIEKNFYEDYLQFQNERDMASTEDVS